MHVGHCRGAVVGDALANLLAKAGWDVTKEYYINDAGAQVQALAQAAYWRYLQALGTTLTEEEYAASRPRRPAISAATTWCRSARHCAARVRRRACAGTGGGAADRELLARHRARLHRRRA